MVLVLVVVFLPKYFCKSTPVERLTADKIEAVKVDPVPDTLITRKKYSPKRIETFDINAADTSEFIALPGIGSKLAARIVMFREKLGGFYSPKQVSEVFGLKDSVYRKITPYLKCDKTRMKRIDINSAGRDELKAHPYIRWNTANILVSYREQHGNFKSAHDLYKIEKLDSQSIGKLAPYLLFK